jgi:thymidylate synthase (FAD)
MNDLTTKKPKSFDSASPENNIASNIEKKSKIHDPLGDQISSVELIRVSGSDLDVVNAARVSYGKISLELTDRDKKLIKYLIEHKHTSPFEHNQLSFRVKAPIFVVRQWMRHRMNSYNEISYRYVESALEFFVPKNWRFQDKINHQGSFGSFESTEAMRLYEQSIEQAKNSYLQMLNLGVCREQARAVLPVTTYTEFIFTCNLHSLLHFLNLRLAKGAQWEIQQYAKALLSLSEPYFPETIGSWININIKDPEFGRDTV